jgi:caffeoyl-CoA O-methyltransferase
VGAKHVVEVGTSTGYSGLWLNLGLQATGGRLTTFELDPNRAATARRYFQKAGVDQQATVVVGDAHKGVAGITEPVDLVFLDADKEGYVDYLEKLLPRMRPGGLILAHNVTRAPGYLERVSGDPNLETMLFMHGGGMAITMKKR